MELRAETAELYVRDAFAKMLEVAERLGDDRVNERPLGPETNTAAALIVHSCGVVEFWIGHVALGRASDRDREAEFTSVATLPELHTMAGATLARVGPDLRQLEAGDTDGERIVRQFLVGDDESDGALVLHVLRELYQHLGHMEITADALLSKT